MSTTGLLRVFGKVLHLDRRNINNMAVKDEPGRAEMLSQTALEDMPAKQEEGGKISFGRAGEFDADWDGWVSVKDIVPAWFA